MPKKCIIIGASHAGVQLAFSLRQEGWEDQITIISNEACLPYHRPPLSKAFLSGAKNAQEILLKKADAYVQNDIEIRLDLCVDSINRQQKTIGLNNGENLSYDKLAICTGARVRKLSLPGISLAGIHYLRSLDDAQKIHQEVANVNNVVIIGGGYIGLETASVLNKLGKNITILENGERILARVTSPEVSDFYSRLHQEEGVKILTNVGVQGFNGSESVTDILLKDGATVMADMVLVAVGVMPNTELAEAAGIEVNNGILVDKNGVTSDSDIFATGDCSNHFNKLYQRRIRLESVPSAMNQSRTAAAFLCNHAKPSNDLPWFWSDQYDVKLQIAGLNQDYDKVITIGDKDSARSFAVFYVKDDKLISADCINTSKAFSLAKKLIAESTNVSAPHLLDNMMK
jgi:3-phenylpropionate/trans-cinnamate dioxygenase ferredoxin reductase subunit